jgi:hypothetical protein
MKKILNLFLKWINPNQKKCNHEFELYDVFDFQGKAKCVKCKKTLEVCESEILGI